MKNRIMKNLWLKLLALVVAFIVWLVIINITDPTISRQFTDIPVDILNEIRYMRWRVGKLWM